MNGLFFRMFFLFYLSFYYLSAFSVTPAEIRRIAKEAYLYGFPIIATKVYYQNNISRQLQNNKHQAIELIDISKKPYHLNLLHTPKQNYPISLVNSWGEIFFVPGGISFQPYNHHFVIVGPGLNTRLANDVTPLKSPTELLWVVPHLTMKNKEKAFTQQLNVFKKLFDMETETYFQQLAMLLKNNHPATNDSTKISEFNKIGFQPGVMFHFSDSIYQSAIEEGVQLAKNIISLIEIDNKEVNKTYDLDPKFTQRIATIQKLILHLELQAV